MKKLPFLTTTQIRWESPNELSIFAPLDLIQNA